MIFAIVAGGSGTRLPGALRKQYRLLAGQAVLARTLAVFEASPVVDALVLAGARRRFKLLPGKFSAVPGKPVELVAGGRERQESVYHGALPLPAGEGDLVAIHDAVRPLLAAHHLAACVEGARRWGASVLAVPAVDTLKRVGPGVLEATLDRRNVWLAQTPQAFRTALIFKAHVRARREGLAATDDAQLVERLGAPVQVVAGSPTNLKITTAEDLILAEALLQAGGVEQGWRRRRIWAMTSSGVAAQSSRPSAAWPANAPRTSKSSRITVLPALRARAISDSVPAPPAQATTTSLERTLMALRALPMPVTIATSIQGAAWRRSASGRIPTVSPPRSWGAACRGGHHPAVAAAVEQNPIRGGDQAPQAVGQVGALVHCTAG